MWHIGNTTVRSPFRLRSGLKALEESPLHGDLVGKPREQAFADLLHDMGVVYSRRRAKRPGSPHDDLGRKWRVALGQLGFLSYHFTVGHKHGVDQKLKPLTDGVPGLTGNPYEVTPLGRLLMDAEGIISQQEIFLRSLAAYRIPSPVERRYKHAQFSPLRFVIEILRDLDCQGMEPHIAFDEMALFVQQNTPDDGVDNVVGQIRDYRSDRANAVGSVAKFVSDAYDEAEGHSGTRRDYADVNLRYLRGTGLFNRVGRGIALDRRRAQVIQGLIAEPLAFLEDSAYLRQLWQGAPLPTDDRQIAIDVIRELESEIRQGGAEVEEIDVGYLDDVRLQFRRHQLEAQLMSLREHAFAEQQADQSDEIVAYLNGFMQSGKGSDSVSDEILIPQQERPAYLEWTVWRAFLAIDSLANSPWDARNFEIDNDMLPVSHAIARRPDMSFEFEDAIVVVEVTLIATSTQEAREGESVRRHVATLAGENDTGKPVYGLFIAPEIDSNTAHTFRSDVWYSADDSKLNLRIVPMRLNDFRDLFQSLLLVQEEAPGLLRAILDESRQKSTLEAPLWKEAISQLVRHIVEEPVGERHLVGQGQRELASSLDA